jgi:hypothetical protein
LHAQFNEAQPSVAETFAHGVVSKIIKSIEKRNHFERDPLKVETPQNIIMLS